MRTRLSRMVMSRRGGGLRGVGRLWSMDLDWSTVKSGVAIVVPY